jgi:hypothetical protein
VRKAHAFIAVILTLAVVFAISMPLFAANTAPDVIILKGNPMGGVKFNHALHSKDRSAGKCNTCHHAAKPEKKPTSATESCADCHTKTATAPMKTTYKLAFHDAMAKKGVCIDCHLAQNAKGKKAPTKCTECHQKANV